MIDSNQVAVGTVKAAEMLDIPRTKLFELLKEKQMRSFKIGRLRMVPVSELRSFVERKTAEAQQ